MTLKKHSFVIASIVVTCSLLLSACGAVAAPNATAVPPTAEPTLVPTPTVVPIPTLTERLERSPVVVIDNATILALSEAGDAEMTSLIAAVGRLIRWSPAWKDMETREFDLSILAYDPGSGAAEAILFGTLGDQTFVLGKSNLGVDIEKAINAPLMSEETEEGSTYYYQDKKENRVDLFRDRELDGEPGLEFTLVDGQTTQFFPDSQLAEGIKETTDAVVGNLSPVKLAKYVNLVYENYMYVKKDDARLIVGKLDAATGEWTELRDGMTEEERETYKNMYPKCADNGVLESTDCAVVSEADFRSGKVLKHILALMDDMPPLPENTVENVKMELESGVVYVAPQTIPLASELPFDFVNLLVLDSPQIKSQETGEPLKLYISYVRVHNKDGSYGILAISIFKSDFEKLIKEGGISTITPAYWWNSLKHNQQFFSKYNLRESDLSVIDLSSLYYEEYKAWLDEYMETGNVPRGLARMVLGGTTFDKIKHAKLVE